ncbi:MAG: NUDIX hydrolase [Firmicutes bacterium]|nr:NUDIX hydrolase [Bacillota bacterium]
MNDNMLFEEAKSTSPIFAGKIIKLRVDTVILPNGKEATREVIEHAPAVAIVPITDDGQVVFVRQYRYPVGEVLLEVPAGKLDDGEPPSECALRELEEETGFTARSLEEVGAFYTTPGFSNELMHLFIARDLSRQAPRPDEDEFISTELIPIERALAMAKSGQIRDAKTLAGLLMLDCTRNQAPGCGQNQG